MTVMCFFLLNLWVLARIELKLKSNTSTEVVVDFLIGTTNPQNSHV
jgi:hypothetical protein